ncbi:MAG: Fur family transcriptional regulator [Desulfarculaceae bacterium]|jgi:Fur family peroxide stress response transcriptional regulator
MLASLREAGHRVTPQRLVVLKILAESRNHPSVEQVYEQVRVDFPTTSLATIYKTMNLLKELGEVLELGFASWGSRYDGNRPYPHPHVVCTKCGAIVDPEFAPLDDMSREMARMSGYRITHHRLDFFGLCPRCQAGE